MREDTQCTQGLTIGLDLGDRRTEACVLDAGGTVQRRFSFSTTAGGLEKALGCGAPARVVLEVGTHSPWLSRQLEAWGHEVIVANAKELRSISQSDRKNDRSDAEQLARLGRVDPALLRPIHHRGESAQRARARLAVRDALVRTRAALINQARGLSKALGERLPRCRTASFARRMRKQGCQAMFPGMETLVEMIDQLSQAIGAEDQEIERMCDTVYPETKILRQVSGVGPITSLTYVLTLEDPRRFERSRAVGAYLGLRPRQRDSGDARPQLRITKAGDPYLRRTLVQAAHYILGPFGPDTDLRRFGQRLVARGGRGAKRKALIAVARKLAVLLHRLWLNQATYVPLRTASTLEGA